MNAVLSPAATPCQRILYVNVEAGLSEQGGDGTGQGWEAVCELADSLGFDTVLISILTWEERHTQGAHEDPGLTEAHCFRSGETVFFLCDLLAACSRHDLLLMMDLVLDEPEEGGVKAQAHRLACWAEAGVAGFRCLDPAALAGEDWRDLIMQVRVRSPFCRFMAWTPGLTPMQLQALAQAGFDATFLSLPWWDYRAAWLLHEHARLQKVAPVFAPVADPGKWWGAPLNHVRPARVQALRALWTAALTGRGVLVPLGMEKITGTQALSAINTWIKSRLPAPDPVRILNGPMYAVTVLFQSGYVLVINPDDAASVTVSWLDIRARLPGSYASFQQVTQQNAGSGDVAFPHERLSLGPQECILFLTLPATNVKVVRLGSGDKSKGVAAALRSPRIVIENVTPNVDGGRFPIKRTLGQPILVQADVFMDGHDQISANLLWKAAGNTGWHEVPMRLLENDRWQAEFTAVQLGRHSYTVRAWLDNGSLCRHETQSRMPDEATALGLPEDHLFEVTCDVSYPLVVERREAVFSSWYELFPRSAAATPGAHGTLQDVIKRLGAIRDMGFDVVYFPPIHPVGLRNRKGKNNALQAEPQDPGSPYAIGSQEGGHDAVHPQLGTLDDFRELVNCAATYGLEIALDFAVQCSPDHPWLTEHPEWFAWRADGTVQHARNPPKEYQDIVNPDFYSKTATQQQRAQLWARLRDVVLFWVEQGVRTFRVDNPHTKPLPFWQWLISQVQSVHPETLFLSEAFTRPKMMYRLAKVGFSQSYTYFTWRNTKPELTEYLTELNQAPVADFFRPHFFVNTPDINPYFLQTSGRAGFLIRAALATTMSGLWGMYSGFELCEASALPGKEEYLDSEKYELRYRDWESPGNIIAQITQLNQIRRSNPALQTHLGIRFEPISNEHIVFFSKSTPQRDNVVFVVINLDPHATHEGTLELPLWQWQLPDDGELELEDLVDAHRFSLRGKYHWVSLPPEQPYLLWSVVRSL